MILTIGYLMIQAFMKRRASRLVLVVCALTDLYGLVWVIKLMELI